MKILDYMQEKYDTREDKDNIFCVGISDAEFRKFAIDYLLGEDWYVVDPLGRDQVNEIALSEILEKYFKRFKREKKERARNDQRRCIKRYAPKDISQSDIYS